ncbi:MAG: hypothetical protein LBH42_04625 [Treponema sp.]|jgi:uroporphyrinogen decarboxylase|nr:hypothetical protein [Treponema sp.]
MTSRERVRAVLAHKEPDRTPVDLGSTNVSSMHIKAYQKLLELLGIEDNNIQFIDFGQQLVVPSDAFINKLGVDTKALKLPGSKTKKIKFLTEDHSEYEDVWGIVWRKPPGGLYYDSVVHPLANLEDVETVAHYQWPAVDDLCSDSGLRDIARPIYENSDFSIVGSCGGSIFMLAQDLRGYENFLVDMMAEKEIATYTLDRITELRIAMTGRLLDQAGEYIDIVKIGDDLGGQNAPLISLELFRELIKPRTEKLIRFIKENSKAAVLYHCCGSMRCFIPDLIEIGVDILNPIQTQAAGMDPLMLKKDFGDKLVFWGGIDTQKTLSKGTPDDVRSEVRERIAQMGSQGGYVVCASHNIQADVPPENVLAMVEEASCRR